MMIVEDNSFDFVVRDHLRKKFEKKVLPSSWQRSKDHLMLDMITYCSREREQGGCCQQSHRHHRDHGWPSARLQEAGWGMVGEWIPLGRPESMGFHV